MLSTDSVKRGGTKKKLSASTANTAATADCVRVQREATATTPAR